MVVGTVEAILKLRDEMTERLTKASASLKNIGETATRAGTALSVGFTAPVVAAGTGSVMAFAGFERVMNQVAAVTSDGEANFEALREAALEWGAKTQYSAKEAGDALFELGKAGLTSKQQIGALGPTLQLATAAQMSLGDAAALSANMMSTFNLSAGQMSHANDILARAAASATLDVTDLRETLKYAGPVAQATGNDLAFVSAAASMMAGAGIKGSQAGTALKGALGDLLNPTKKTRDGLEELGFTMDEIMSGQLKLPEVLDRLKDANDRAALSMKIFGEYAGPGMTALAKDGGAALEKLAEEFRNTDGDAQRMADATMKGLGGALETMRGGIETAGIALGELLSPAVRRVAELVGQLAEYMTNTAIPAFKGLPEPVQAIIGGLVALLAAAGPILLVIGGMATGFAAIAPILTAAGGALGFLLGPIGLVVAAVVGLTAAWLTWGDDVTAAVVGTYNAVKEWLWDKFGPIVEPVLRLIRSIADLWQTVFQLQVAIFAKIVGAVAEMVTSVVGWIAGKLEPVFKPVINTIAAVASAFSAMKDKVVGFAQQMYEGVKSWALDKFTAVVDGIREKVDAVSGFFKKLYIDVVGGSYFPDMIEGIGVWAAKLPNLMTAPIKKETEKVAASFANLRDAWANIGSTVVGALQGGGNVGKAVGASLGGSLGKDVGAALSTAIGGSLGKAIGSFAGPLGALAGSAIGGAISGLFGKGEGRKLVEQFAESMGGFGALRDKMNTLGPDAERLWVALTQGVGKNNPEQARAAIKAIEDAFASAAAKTRAMETELQSLQARMMDLHKASNPTWRDMKAAADEFGVSIAALGPAFQQQRLTERATEIWNAFDTMKRGGADVNEVLKGMGDEIGVFVEESLKFKTKIPENLRPLIEQLHRSGQLIGANGEAIENIAGLQFGEPVKSQWELVADEIGRLSEAIAALTSQLRGEVVSAVGDVTRAFSGIPSDFEFRINRVGGGDGDEGASRGFATGTLGQWYDFGTSTAVRLHGRQRIMTEAEGRGAGAGSRTLVLKVGEREFGRIALRAIAEAADEYGVGIG